MTIEMNLLILLSWVIIFRAGWHAHRIKCKRDTKMEELRLEITNEVDDLLAGTSSESI